jgi:hypothetical protein
MGLAPRLAASVGRSSEAGRLRLIVWCLLGLTLGAFAGTTWWWGLVDVRRRTLHDRLTGVVVTRRG